MTPAPDDGPPSELRAPDAWFALGEELYREVVEALARYGVRVHPLLRFVPAATPTPYYAAAEQTIGFGVPDPTTA